MSLSTLEEGFQSRFNTVYSVSFPEFPTFRYQPYKITIVQEERSHDIAVLRFQRQTNWYHKALKTGTLVKITWQNNRKAKGSFYGHVVSYKRTRAAQMDGEIEVRCVAASFPLKNSISNTWVNKTIPEVVQDIAKKNKMKAVVTPHKGRFSQLPMYGMSYWEFLQELSYKVGYAFWVEGTTIYFKSFDELIEKNFGAIPILNFTEDFIPAFHSFVERTLDKFEPVLSDYVEDVDQPVRATKTLTGVDPIKGISYSSNNQAKKTVRKNAAQVVFTDNSSLDVANSKSFADSLTKAKAERTRFQMPANFYGQGDPRIRPFNLVEVSGVDSTTDGYWLVRSVVHTMTKDGHYFSDGVVVSDGRGQNVAGPKRVKGSALMPTLNLTNFGDNDRLSLKKGPKPSKNVFSYNETQSGYTLNAQSWRG
jgi:phage protein D